MVSIYRQSIFLSLSLSFKCTGLVTSVCNSTFWLGVIVSNQLAPIIISTPLRVSGLLLLFLAATVINYLFVLFFLPETKVSY